MPTLNEGPPLPPLEVPLNRLAARDPNAIAVDGWLLYPTLRLYSALFGQSVPQSDQPDFRRGVGVTPSLTAVWSNGIHTTTLYGNFDRQSYPTHNEVDTLDGRAGFSQRYEAMRDLIFTVDGNYSHTTWATGLQNSLQAFPSAPTSVLLSNGNTVLPNGSDFSPTGQPVGQTSRRIGQQHSSLVVNPSNQYNGTFQSRRYSIGAFSILSGSLNRTDFEMQNRAQSELQQSHSQRTCRIWLSPLFYVYSDGVATNLVTDGRPTSPSVSTDTYRVIGGLGTRQFGSAAGSIYYGSQGSQSR